MTQRTTGPSRPEQTIFAISAAWPDKPSPASGGDSARLRSALGEAGVAAAWRCAQTLVQRLADRGRPLDGAGILVMYGGGKDSSFAVAFTRLVQLLLRDTFGRSFLLRSATYRHAGMTPAVMDNIDRCYQRLGLFDDPAVQLILVDGEHVSSFSRLAPLPEIVRTANRDGLLMGAHATGGDARSTFCDACNLGMTRTFVVAADWGAPVDLIVTGDSPAEQLRYAAWTRRAAERFDIDTPGRDLPATLDRLGRLGQAYQVEIHGPSAAASPAIGPTLSRIADFFSVYPFSAYELGNHRALVEDFLGFRFDPSAWVFTESDCANPLIMASMRGLMHERLRSGDYAEGLAEYSAFALNLMRQKSFPADLVARMARRMEGLQAAEAFRDEARIFLRDAYGLEERHLVAALHSPFTDQGERLEAWIAAEAPDLTAWIGQIRDLAAGGAAPDFVVDALQAATALEPAQVCHLWTRPIVPNLATPGGADSRLGFVRRHDPHRARILSRQKDGQLRFEIITGR